MRTAVKKCLDLTCCRRKVFTIGSCIVLFEHVGISYNFFLLEPADRTEKKVEAEIMFLG